MYSCADLSVSILVILESSLPAGKCFLNFSSALFRLCILLRSRSFALTRLTRLIKILSKPPEFVLVVELLLSAIATCLALSTSKTLPCDTLATTTTLERLLSQSSSVGCVALATIGLFCANCFEADDLCWLEIGLVDTLDEFEFGDCIQNDENVEELGGE